jgi:small conductance mechanosensitive channel
MLIVAALCVSLLLASAPMEVGGQETEPSAAQEAIASATPDEVGERAAEIMGRLATIIAEQQRYRSMLATASAEDSLVLRLQLEGGVDRFMTEMEKLAAVAPQPDQADIPAELRSSIETIYTELTPTVWELIDERRLEIDDLRAQRTTTPPADRSTLENLVIRVTRRLDLMYEFAARHLEALEDFGLDTTAEREIYTRLLSERADELAGRIDLDLVRISELKAELEEKPDDGDVAQLMIATKKSLDSNATSQAVILDLMDTMEIPTADYRADLLTVTQDLAAGILDARVTATLMRKAWAGLTNWLSEHGPNYLVKFLLFVAILFAGRMLARLVRKAVDTSLGRSSLGISQLLRRTIVSSAHNVVLALALLIALSQLGISLGPLLAGLGVIGFILGFAMQDSLSNFAAGLMILFYRPYDVGDLVEIGGVFGKVEHMSMVSTSVLTLDNQKLVVPNSKIWGDVIKNVTDQNVRRVDMTFGISYSDDIPQAERVLGDILAQHERVLNDPEPMVHLHTLGESSVDFIVRPWVKTDDYWDVYWDVTRSVKMRFDAEGISIPFPQRDVHLYAESKANAAKTLEETGT